MAEKLPPDMLRKVGKKKPSELIAELDKHLVAMKASVADINSHEQGELQQYNSSVKSLIERAQNLHNSAEECMETLTALQKKTSKVTKASNAVIRSEKNKGFFGERLLRQRACRLPRRTHRR